MDQERALREAAVAVGVFGWVILLLFLIFEIVNDSFIFVKMFQNNFWIVISIIIIRKDILKIHLKIRQRLVNNY